MLYLGQVRIHPGLPLVCFGFSQDPYRHLEPSVTPASRSPEPRLVGKSAAGRCIARDGHIPKREDDGMGVRIELSRGRRVVSLGAQQMAPIGRGMLDQL